LCYLCLQACTSTATETFTCPEKIYVQSQVSDSLAGWQIQNSTGDHFLVSSTFTDGPPAEKGYLRPSDTLAAADSLTGVDAALYDLSEMSAGEAWLVCQYANTPAILAKKLPPAYRKCEVSLPRDISGQKVICTP